MRKPFFRKDRKCWYVKDDAGRFVRLDPDEEKAFGIWERMRRLADFKHPDASLDAIFEAYLADCDPKMSPVKFEDQVRNLEAFALYFGATRFARDVSASDVFRWVKLDRTIGEHKRKWSIARQRDAGQAVKRALSWAIVRGYLPWSDVLELEFETPEPRESLISYALHQQLIAKSMDPKYARSFKLVLIALRLSGARPIQIREVTAANYINGSWVFRKHKTGAKTKKPLVVRCVPCLQTLTRILAHHRPKGSLFINARGDPWTKNGIVLRFRTLREELGIEDVSAYSYRHSYATDALESGLSLVTVAALLGHTNPSMVARVYGHLEKKSDHMDAAIEMMAKARKQK
jgi:integrase